jgi:hypothetical protein
METFIRSCEAVISIRSTENPGYGFWKRKNKTAGGDHGFCGPEDCKTMKDEACSF